MNKKTVWTVVMLTGILMLAGAAGLVVNNALSARKAEKSTDRVLQELTQAISAPQPADTMQPPSHDEGPAETGQPPAGTEEAGAPTEEEQPLPPTEEEEEEQPLPVGMVDGHGYIGLLYIPNLGLELPVMSDFSYDNLKIAPTRFYGDINTHDLIICAHNYDAHFGTLKDLAAGDTVQLQDMLGGVHDYRVSTVTTVGPTALEEVISGQWDLTLLTCTPGGSARVIVRCGGTGT